jgi:hypothetical protein
MRRYFTTLAISALFGVITGAADAQVVGFSLNDIQFSDGGVATGTFYLDESSGQVTAMSIDYTGGSSGVPSYHFRNSDLTYNGFYPASPEGYEFACDRSEYAGCVSATGGGVGILGATDWLYFGIGPHYGYLELDLPAPPSGSTDRVVDASVYNDGISDNYSGVAYDAAIVPLPVPEPATWAAMLLGVFGMGAVLRGARRGALAGVAAA